MTKDNAEYKVKTENGAELTVKHDGFHYRAADGAGKPYGEPFILLTELLKSIKAELAGASNCPPGEKEKAEKEAAEKAEADAAALLGAADKQAEIEKQKAIRVNREHKPGKK